MQNQFDLKKIRAVCQEFFEKMGFLGSLEVGETRDRTLPVRIRTEEPRILIGRNGQTLSEIQHLLKAVLRRKFGSDFYLDLDINGYKEKKIEYLKDLAQVTADEVSLSKKQKTLAPMSSYERRIIHLELAERQDVVTESMGQGLERRVIIKPGS